jgi:hypothetical protein
MPEPDKPKPSIDSPSSRGSDTPPMIFISHDTRDAELAEALSKLLSSVSAGVLKSFRSSDRKGSQGIEYGVEWYPELMSRLDAASDVVCLLTPRSLDRPWILYEAGVAKGKLGTPVYGIALGVPLSRANSGPFAQFQNCDDNEESLTKLVMQLVRRIPGSEPDHDAIQMQVQTFRSRVAGALETLAHDNEVEETSSVDDTSVAKLFEEVKIMFQDLPSRIEGKLTEGGEPPRRSRRFRRFHPMMIDEMVHRVGRGPADPIGILLLASLFREDFPWLYELGMEAYRAARAGKLREVESATTRFQRAAEVTMHGPLMEEFGSKETHIMLMEIPRMLDHIMHRFLEGSEKRSRAKKLPEGT